MVPTLIWHHMSILYGADSDLASHEYFIWCRLRFGITWVLYMVPTPIWHHMSTLYGFLWSTPDRNLDREALPRADNREALPRADNRDSQNAPQHLSIGALEGSEQIEAQDFELSEAVRLYNKVRVSSQSLSLTFGRVHLEFIFNSRTIWSDHFSHFIAVNSVRNIVSFPMVYMNIRRNELSQNGHKKMCKLMQTQ